jgi:5-methylcytosine-specific restriction endonuclease McrA
VAVAADYKALYGTQRWRRLSRLLIARAGGRCEVPGCPNVATSADHVVPALVLAEQGRLDVFFDPANLRAACRSCNGRDGARLGNPRRHQRRRRWLSAQEAAEQWAREENAYWREVERLAGRRPPSPAIY